MYTKTARFYDAVYHAKDYATEVETLRAFIDHFATRPYQTLLDVACGTGHHLDYLCEHYTVQGLDLDENMLKVARQRLPDVPFHQADMASFDLGQTFDVVICLFSSIGYTRTLDQMQQAVATMARHVAPGGLLIIEPWFEASDMDESRLSMKVFDGEALKITRMAYIRVKDGISHTHFEYMVGDWDESGVPHVHHFSEEHVMGLFTAAQYQAALEKTGLNVTHDEEGLIGRGLHIGVKATS